MFPHSGDRAMHPVSQAGKGQPGLRSEPADPGFSSSTASEHGRPGPGDLPPQATARVFRPTHTLNVAPLRELTGRARAARGVCGRDLTGTARPRPPPRTPARDAGSLDSSLSCSGSSFWRQPLFVSRNKMFRDSSAFFPGSGRCSPALGLTPRLTVPPAAGAPHVNAPRFPDRFSCSQTPARLPISCSHGQGSPEPSCVRLLVHVCDGPSAGHRCLFLRAGTAAFQKGGNLGLFSWFFFFFFFPVSNHRVQPRGGSGLGSAC